MALYWLAPSSGVADCRERLPCGPSSLRPLLGADPPVSPVIPGPNKFGQAPNHPVLEGALIFCDMGPSHPSHMPPTIRLLR